MGVVECINHNLVEPYNVLYEKEGVCVCVCVCVCVEGAGGAMVYYNVLSFQESLLLSSSSQYC